MVKIRKNKSKSPKTSRTKSFIISKHNSDDKSVDDTLSCEKSTFTYFATFISFLIIFIINYLALMWITKLEEIDCKCSNSWMRSYIKYYIYSYFIMISCSILINLYILLSGSANLMKSTFNFFTYLTTFFAIISIANLFISIVYINNLKAIDCSCSESIKREIYWYYNLLELSMIFLILILSLIAFLLH
jgi:hypothetical protein